MDIIANIICTKKGSSQHITIAVFSSLRTHLKKCASLANQDRKKLKDKPIIANVGTKKVYFQQKTLIARKYASSFI